MTTADEHESNTGTTTLLAEDLLLMLFQPDSGTIAGENILFYALGGAVVTELAQTGRVTLEDAALGGHRVRAAGENPPGDSALAEAWEYVRDKPRNVQTVLAAVGPNLRGALLDRLVERGDITIRSGKALGIFPTTALELGDGDRRALLIGRMRAVLIDGADPDERIGSLIALISASGTLPSFDREVPWSSAVYTRAKALERGDAGAEAADEAITRTMTAIVVNSVVATAVLPKN